MSMRAGIERLEQSVQEKPAFPPPGRDPDRAPGKCHGDPEGVCCVRKILEMEIPVLAPATLACDQRTFQTSQSFSFSFFIKSRCLLPQSMLGELNEILTLAQVAQW